MPRRAVGSIRGRGSEGGKAGGFGLWFPWERRGEAGQAGLGLASLNNPSGPRGCHWSSRTCAWSDEGGWTMSWSVSRPDRGGGRCVGPGLVSLPTGGASSHKSFSLCGSPGGAVLGRARR